MITKNTTKANIRRIIKKTMAMRFLDDAQLASMAKVSLLTIQHILNEEDDSLPTLRTLIKLSNALDLKIEIFFIGIRHDPNA